MIKETVTGKSLLAFGAAAAFCGATLYAVGQTLNYLFRDVDPDRIEKKGEIETKAAEKEASEDNDPV